MKVHLSNYEVRAYKKKSGNLSFHCTTVLMADYGWNFSTSYIKRLSVYFVLANGKRVDFNLNMNCDSEFNFDGRFNTITLNLSAITQFTAIEDQVIRIILNGSVDFPERTEDISHEEHGVLRKKYFGL